MAGYVFEHEPSFAPTPSAMKNVLSNLCMLDVRIDGNFDGANLIDKYLLDVIYLGVIVDRKIRSSFFKGGSFIHLYLC